MYLCPGCDTELPDEAVFCSGCGIKLEPPTIVIAPARVKQPEKVKIPETPPVAFFQHQAVPAEKARQQPETPAPRNTPAVPPVAEETPLLRPMNAVPAKNLDYPTEQLLPRSVPHPELVDAPIEELLSDTTPQDEEKPIGDMYSSLELSPERIAATRKAAERWRNSWRDRQRAEAGPALGISRGHALVKEPLLMMQHSIARMRAIILPKNDQSYPTIRYRITLLILLCLIVALAAFIVSTYLIRA